MVSRRNLAAVVRRKLSLHSRLKSVRASRKRDHRRWSLGSVGSLMIPLPESWCSARESVFWSGLVSSKDSETGERKSSPCIFLVVMALLE